MMKCLFPYSLVLVISAAATAQPGGGRPAGAIHYQVSAEIRGLGDDSVVLYSGYNDATGREHRDTLMTKAAANRFSLNGSTGAACRVNASLGGFRSRRNFSFFLEEGKINIRGAIDSLESLQVTGTPDNEAMTASNQKEGRIYAQVKTLYAQLKEKSITKEESKAIEKQADDLRDSINRERVRFIQAHPASQLSGIYIYVLSDKIPLEQLDPLYNSLSPQIKKSSFGVIVGEALVAKKRTRIGMEAPPFDMNDVAGNKVRLADYKGKYVLLDFWASWCVPCRAESPYLVAAWQRFKDKGFTILSISMDDNKEKWKDAIAKDGMAWTHISDLQAFGNRVAKLYGVQPIPDNFLIDPAGKIIARGLRGDDLAARLSAVIK